MDRRTFLGLTSLATYSLSGCITEDEGSTNATSGTSATPESTTVTTESLTTRTETTSPTNDAAKRIRKARSLIEDAIRLYASAGEEQNASIVDVDATTSWFPRRDIEVKIQAANRALSEANSTATDGQRQTITTLEHIGQFVTGAASAQSTIIRAYTEATKARDALYEAHWPNVKAFGERAKNFASPADHYVERATRNASPESMTVVSGLTSSEYKAEVAQLNRQADALHTVGEQFLRVEDNIWKYRDAVSQYSDGNYSKSADNFEAAADAFGSVETDIVNQEHEDPVEETYANLKCISGALAGATRHMQEAAVAAENDDTETQNREKQKATSEFHSCEVLEEVLVWVL